jgi:hypothetical protein
MHKVLHKLLRAHEYKIQFVQNRAQSRAVATGIKTRIREVNGLLEHFVFTDNLTFPVSATANNYNALEGLILWERLNVTAQPDHNLRNHA